MAHRFQPSTKARFASRAAATSVVGAMFAAGAVSIWTMHSGIGGVTVRARRGGPWFDLSQSDVDAFVGAAQAA